jgi:Fe-S oxidoreductase
MNFLNKKVTYHTPCELGRNSGVYSEPKEVIKHVAILEPTGFDDENSLCCGGSLGNLMLSSNDRRKIAGNVVSELTRCGPDYIITSCPLCKKTLASVSDTKISDISEIVAEALAGSQPAGKIKFSEIPAKESAGIFSTSS